MRRRAAAGAVLVATLVVLAGCSVLDPSPAAGPDATGAPTDTWAGDPDNPYRTETLVVAVANGGNDSRRFAPLVREALSYWEANAETHAGFPISYVVAPNATDPDVVVRVVATLRCGDEDHAAGCADVIAEPAQFDPPETVRVVAGLSNDSTVHVLRHEFGHTLGLTHDDEPQSIMAPTQNLTTLPQVNATDRPVPWADPTLGVYVDVSALPPAERDDARAQVREAADYYSRGAAGTVPENVSVSLVDNRSAAEVTVVAVEDLSCRPAPGSCGQLLGVDPDGDGALERYTELRVTFAGLDTDAVGWHVGRWLGHGFGFETESEYPPPLRENASYEERRSEWWE